MQGFSSVRAPVLARDGKQYQAIGYQPDQVELGTYSLVSWKSP
jgi:hypothetical protein